MYTYMRRNLKVRDAVYCVDVFPAYLLVKSQS